MFALRNWALALVTLHLGIATAEAQAQKYFISVTKKDSVTRFVTRYEAAQYQVVVTTTPVPNARSRPVTISAREDLHIVELTSASEPRLPREIFRYENFAGLVVPKNTDLSLVLHGHFGATRVSGPETQLPTYSNIRMAVQPRSLRSPIIINPETIQGILSEFSGHIDTTVGGKKVNIKERKSAANRELARAYLIERYQKLGLKAETLPYKTGANVVAIKPGVKDPKKFIIVSSHMDNVGNAGANDDGSGTSSVLAIAQALAKVPLDFTVRFMAFDEEEKGLIGSSAYVQSATDLEDLIATFHTDMTGRPISNKKAMIADCDRGGSKAFAELMIATMGSLKIPIDATRGCLGRSDHSNFWKINKPAFLVVEDGGYDLDPCYHKACDVAPDQDYTYMAHLATGLANTILNLKLQ